MASTCSSVASKRCAVIETVDCSNPDDNRFVFLRVTRTSKGGKEVEQHHLLHRPWTIIEDGDPSDRDIRKSAIMAAFEGVDPERWLDGILLDGEVDCPPADMSKDSYRDGFSVVEVPQSASFRFAA
jgi:hypothetical protein